MRRGDPRARAPRPHLLHVGTLPPRDWARDESVRVVGAEAPAEAPAAPPAPARAAPADTDTARELAALAAAGWTRADLARRLARAVGAAPASVERTLRRWAQGGEVGAASAPLREALRALAGEARDPVDALRARVVWLLRGRGVAPLWAGSRGAVGLRDLARRAGLDVHRDDLEAFAGGGDAPALVAVLGAETPSGATVLAVLEAVHGVAPPPPLAAASTVPERARAVAEGDVTGSRWQRGDRGRLRPGPAPAAEPAAPRRGFEVPRVRPPARAQGGSGAPPPAVPELGPMIATKRR